MCNFHDICNSCLSSDVVAENLSAARPIWIPNNLFYNTLFFLCKIWQEFAILYILQKNRFIPPIWIPNNFFTIPLSFSAKYDNTWMCIAAKDAVRDSKFHVRQPNKASSSMSGAFLKLDCWVFSALTVKATDIFSKNINWRINWKNYHHH